MEWDYGNVVTGSKDMSSLSEIERTIYGCIQSKGICTADMISIHTSLNIKDVTGILNILDIKSFINYDHYIASRNIMCIEIIHYLLYNP